MVEVEEKYMARCIELAKAVVVHKGRIIGEGFHRKCGEAHAEVNAIASVKDESLLKDSTIYVSLEPCSHYGKTPPCAELIIRKGIPRVEVSGRGVRMLREAGVEVVTGVMEEEARALNKAFMTLQTKGRPYIILKWAQSEDGFIDRLRMDVSEPVTVLSSPETSRLVHKLRSEVAAIMVGTRTALLDNPSLNVRHWSGNSPVRVVLDRRLVIPDSYRLLNGSSRTLIFTEKEVENRENVEYIRIDFEGPVIRQVLDHLAVRKLDSLLVEGGTQLINSFVEADVWDEARVETAPVRLYQGVHAPMLGKEAVSGISGRSVMSIKNHNYEILNHNDEFEKS